jgi:predicted GNAT family acetyltransferase
MPNRSQVTRNRFEYEEEGKVAFLEFETDDLGWITLLRTEVPRELRGRGIAGILVRTAFEHARNHHLRIDVLCPLAADYLKRHPELKNPAETTPGSSQ